MRLEGQRVLVTGGSRSIALGVAREGADVAVNFKSSPEGAESAVREIEGWGRPPPSSTVGGPCSCSAAHITATAIPFPENIWWGNSVQLLIELEQGDAGFGAYCVEDLLIERRCD
jgi:NAD(P)-dependent dehydrogenase (short-subunit alcohol dehydrogenase family)